MLPGFFYDKACLLAFYFQSFFEEELTRDVVQADASQTCSQSESHDLWIMKCYTAAVSPAQFLQDGGVGESCD